MSAGPVSRTWRRFLRFSVRGLIVLVLFVGVWLGWLVHLRNIISLGLHDTQVTDAGLPHLKGLGKLRGLDLSRTHVTDTGLAHLKGLTSLIELWLADTQVTDAGLAHLKGLNNLSSLGLNKTRVTDVGVNGLKKALPRPAIHR